MVVTMTQGAGFDMEVRKHGEHFCKQLTDGIVIRYLTCIAERGNVVAGLGIGEGCHGSIGIVAILCVDMRSDRRFSDLANAGL
jgi:hypothetical protein